MGKGRLTLFCGNGEQVEVRPTLNLIDYVVLHIIGYNGSCQHMHIQYWNTLKRHLSITIISLRLHYRVPRGWARLPISL